MKDLLNNIKKVEEARFLIASKKPEGLTLLQTTYHKAFGEYYTENCSPCHEKAYFKLMQILNNPNNYQKMSNRKYLLKDGHQVQIFGGEVYTNANLTDEKAIELLEENPKRATSFEVINGEAAADWDGKIVKVLKPVTGAKPTVPQTIELIKSTTSKEELEGLVQGDERAGIKDAVAAKLEEFSKASEKITKILTQEDLDENPELVEQGLKVGDKVEITED